MCSLLKIHSSSQNGVIYVECMKGAFTAVMWCMQLQNVSMLADDIEAQQKLRSEMLTPDKRLRRSPGTALQSSPATSAGPCMVCTGCCNAYHYAHLLLQCKCCPCILM